MLRPMHPQMSAEFASLQLTLVDRFVELGLGGHADGIDQLTNFQRRLGIGTPTDPPSNPDWIDLVDRLAAIRRHDDRVDALMDDFDRRPAAVPQHIVDAWPTVGAFSIQVVGTVARTHFFVMDTDDESPLHPSKLEIRRSELHEVLSAVRSAHPELTHVAGGSWLYSTKSYASLFPEVHVRNAQARTDRRTFRGMSHWGQFLDHQWGIRTNLADEFRRRVRSWTGEDPCSLFPIDTLDVSSPIEAFALGRGPGRRS